MIESYKKVYLTTPLQIWPYDSITNYALIASLCILLPWNKGKIVFSYSRHRLLLSVWYNPHWMLLYPHILNVAILHCVLRLIFLASSIVGVGYFKSLYPFIHGYCWVIVSVLLQYLHPYRQTTVWKSSIIHFCIAFNKYSQRLPVLQCTTYAIS